MVRSVELNDSEHKGITALEFRKHRLQIVHMNSLM
jgi:hypothetical protein